MKIYIKKTKKISLPKIGIKRRFYTSMIHQPAKKIMLFYIVIQKMTDFSFFSKMQFISFYLKKDMM